MRHRARDHLGVGADVGRVRPISTASARLAPSSASNHADGADQRLGEGERGIGVLLHEVRGKAEDLLRIVLEDLRVGDDRQADALEHRGLVRRRANQVAGDRARLQRRWHLRRRRDQEEHVRPDLALRVARCVEPGVEPAGGEPVAQLVVVGRDREDHAHVEGATFGVLPRRWRAAARRREIGCTGLPSAPVGIPGFIRSQTAFETVMALPVESIESGVTI